MTETRYESLWTTILGGAIGFFIGWLSFSIFITLLNFQGIPIYLYTLSEPLALMLEILNYVPILGFLFQIAAYPAQAIIPMEGLFGSIIGATLGGAFIGLRNPMIEKIGIDILRDDIMLVLGIILFVISFLFNILTDSLLVYTGFLIGEIFIFIFIGTQLTELSIDLLENIDILPKEEKEEQYNQDTELENTIENLEAGN